jgi:type IV secretory pathway VirD2 relaxase
MIGMTTFRAISHEFACLAVRHERDGVTRDGEKAHMFSAEEGPADAAGFARRGHDDRHHFRFIVAPEDAAGMTDLKAFTRDLVAQMERDLGTRLDWVAVDHWNTDNPHVHLLVRGVAEDGSDLVVSRDYISHGLRSRAEDLVSAELGPKPEHEIRSALEREVEAERWTRAARHRQAATARTHGPCDGRRSGPMDGWPRCRTQPARPWIAWRHHQDHAPCLHRAGSGPWHRRLCDRHRSASITGRLVDKGLHDELTGEAYAVIDGTDGRAHHVRFRGIEAFEHAPHIGGIVELRRFGGPDDAHPTLVLANRSDVDLAAQVTAPGATWLDHRLVERQAMPLAMGGFGQETRDAMAAQAEHLVTEGLARRQGQRIILQRDFLNTLRRRELDAAAAKLASMIWLSLHPSPPSETSAFSRIRAFINRCAELFPFRINACRCSRSSALSRTTYFFTRTSLADMIRPRRYLWPQERIRKSFQIR